MWYEVFKIRWGLIVIITGPDLVRRRILNVSLNLTVSQ